MVIVLPSNFQFDYLLEQGYIYYDSGYCWFIDPEPSPAIYYCASNFDPTPYTKGDESRKCIPISADQLHDLPPCDYVINQYDVVEGEFWDSNIGIKVIPGLIAYLNELLVEYNNTPRYLILNLYNCLTYEFGKFDKSLLM